MGMGRKKDFQKKMHQFEKDLMDALIHPEDGEQRRRYVKRFIYGETVLTANTKNHPE